MNRIHRDTSFNWQLRQSLACLRRVPRRHSAERCKLLISLAMPVSTINAPMTSATARYADSLRLSVAPMMEGADSQ